MSCRHPSIVFAFTGLHSCPASGYPTSDSVPRSSRCRTTPLPWGRPELSRCCVRGVDPLCGSVESAPSEHGNPQARSTFQISRYSVSGRVRTRRPGKGRCSGEQAERLGSAVTDAMRCLSSRAVWWRPRLHPCSPPLAGIGALHDSSPRQVDMVDLSRTPRGGTGSIVRPCAVVVLLAYEKNAIGDRGLCQVLVSGEFRAGGDRSRKRSSRRPVPVM